MAARLSGAWPMAREEAMRDEKSETASLESFEREETLVVGTTNLYQNGQLRLIPVRCARREGFRRGGFLAFDSTAGY